ncbi:hypothetical protein GCM10023210_44400 [Chryseobacterium ginsengisoli]|uniref:Uncharacterized protein n=1 Tax=Chryseobacterium ginsengisoli TaxID=363853 RepID=A0ABP9MVN0_9FLAO
MCYFCCGEGLKYFVYGRNIREDASYTLDDALYNIDKAINTPDIVLYTLDKASYIWDEATNILDIVLYTLDKAINILDKVSYISDKALYTLDGVLCILGNIFDIFRKVNDLTEKKHKISKKDSSFHNASQNSIQNDRQSLWIYKFFSFLLRFFSRISNTMLRSLREDKQAW